MDNAVLGRKLNFVKLAGYWFAHLPNYEGDPSDLVMVSGADVMCDMLDKDEDGFIQAYISDKQFDLCERPTFEYVLDFVNSTGEDGANYRLREWKLDVWLCNVTKYVFGEFPAEIYIRI